MSRITKETVTFESEAIIKAQYFPLINILKVFYKNESKYLYIDVEPFVWDGMKRANSVGRFINYYIKSYYEFHRQD